MVPSAGGAVSGRVHARRGPGMPDRAFGLGSAPMGRARPPQSVGPRRPRRTPRWAASLSARSDRAACSAPDRCRHGVHGGCRACSRTCGDATARRSHGPAAPRRGVRAAATGPWPGWALRPAGRGRVPGGTGRTDRGGGWPWRPHSHGGWGGRRPGPTAARRRPAPARCPPASGLCDVLQRRIEEARRVTRESSAPGGSGRPGSRRSRGSALASGRWPGIRCRTGGEVPGASWRPPRSAPEAERHLVAVRRATGPAVRGGRPRPAARSAPWRPLP